jgi:outer membrane protein assembly factor BamB
VQIIKKMKKQQRILFLTLSLIAILLTGCSSKSFNASSWPGVTIGENTAYVAYNQFVYAVSLADGKELWRFPAEADRSASFYAPPAITQEGQVIVAGYNNVIYSLDAETGKEIWSQAVASNRFIDGPLVTKQGIFAPSSDGKLYALDTNGNPLWEEPFAAEHGLWATPATDGRRLYVAALDHTVTAIHTADGQILWQQDLSSALVSTPAVSQDGRLYLGTLGNEVIALDASNGSILWRKPTQGWVWSGPALVDGRLYFGDLSGTITAMNAADGSILWAKQPDGPITGCPLVTEEAIIYATEAGTLYSVTLEGEPLWEVPLGGKLYAHPVTDGQLILVAPMGGQALLVALDWDGRTVWSFVPEEN